jgi:hypothetical protein
MTLHPATFPRKLAKWSLIALLAVGCADALADKTLRIALPIAETSFDPAFATDDTSGVVIR